MCAYSAAHAISYMATSIVLEHVFTLNRHLIHSYCFVRCRPGLRIVRENVFNMLIKELFDGFAIDL